MRVVNTEFTMPKLTGNMYSLAGGILLCLYLLTGMYIVGPDEQAVVLAFGKYTQIESPGLHWYFPRPVGQIIKVKVTKVYRIEIGFKTEGQQDGKSVYSAVDDEAVMFTGDENILVGDYIVQYKIKDIKKYVFNLKEPNRMIKNAAQAALRQVVGYNKLEDVLTTGKDRIQEEAKTILQTVLDRYEAGISIMNVQLQDVQPPVEVLAAFKDVASAKEDKMKYINEANGYANDILPQARGEAQQKINEALAYKEKRIKEAEGDVSRFLSLYEKYKLGKEVTETRLYLETLEKVLPNADKVFVDKDMKNGLVNILGKDLLPAQKEQKGVEAK